MPPGAPSSLRRAVVDASMYKTGSVRDRIRAVFLDNLGAVVTTEQLKAVAHGAENWHQRLSELRTDEGFTIETIRDRPGVLARGEYLMASKEVREQAAKRVKPTRDTWKLVLEQAAHCCEWVNDGAPCGLSNGAIDPVGGGTVRLQADHLRPHEMGSSATSTDATAWQALCGRHQVMKKNFWDCDTGKVNLVAALQAASLVEKRLALNWLNTALQQHPVVPSEPASGANDVASSL